MALSWISWTTTTRDVTRATNAGRDGNVGGARALAADGELRGSPLSASESCAATRVTLIFHS